MEQRYLTLRRKLDHLGYRQPFNLDSVLLVEKLLNDLVHQSDHLKSIHREPAPKKFGFLHKGCDHSDYGRIIKENNELHRQIIKTKEDCDKDLKALSSQLRKVENQNVDLQFLNNQYYLKIQRLEKENKLKADRLQEQQEKNLQAIIQTPAGNTKKFHFRHQRLDIDSLVPPSASAKPVHAENFGNQQRNRQQHIDLVKVADERVEQLQSEIKFLKLASEQAEELVSSLKKKVDVTNNENERLTELLESKSFDKCACAHINNIHAGNDHHVIAHLNFEIDHLKRLNVDLEKQLKQAINSSREMQAKSSNLTTHNKQLELELNDVDKVAQALKRQKDELVSTADKEMNEAKVEVVKLYAEVERMKEEISRLKNERDNLLQDKCRLESDLFGCETKQKEQLQISEQLKQNKNEMEERLNQVLAQYDELHAKLDRIGNNVGPAVVDPPLETYLHQIIHSIERQRNYYKEQVEKLSQQLSGKQLSTSTPIAKQVFHGFQTDPLIKLLEEERDLYKNECIKLKAGFQPRASSPLDANQVDEFRERNLRVLEEKEELNRTLDSMEKHVEEVNNALKAITDERDKWKKLFEQETKLRENAEIAIPRKSTSDAIILKAQLERDEAMAEFQKLFTETEDLRNRLRLATETQITERRRLEKRIIDLETQTLAGSAECAELLSKNSSYQALLTSMEDQLQVLQTRLVDLQNEAFQEKSNANKLQILAQQTEKSLKDAQRILTQNVSDRGQAEKIVQDLEVKIDKLNQVIDEQKNEISALQRSRSALDKEKDAFQMDVDYKTEQLAALNQELQRKLKEIADLKIASGNMEASLSQLVRELHEKDNDMKSLTRQLESSKKDAEEAKRSREEILRQFRHLQDDMMVMTRENQALEHDLQNSQDEKETLKRRIQEYVAEVSRVEDLLRDKEQERTDLLEQYRALTNTTTSLESHKSQLESQANNTHMELLAKETELRHFQDIVAALNLEIENNVSKQRESDLQILNLHQNLNATESRLEECQRERDHLQRDMLTMRELCVKLDSNKENLSDEIRGRTHEIEKLRMTVFEQQQHVDSLTTQLATQKLELDSLEHLLANNRQKEFHSQLENRELNDELRMHKDRLDKVETKLEEQTQNATRYRNRATELEIEVDRLKRQLTNEQFERERLNQELKRSKQTWSVGASGRAEPSTSNLTGEQSRQRLTTEITPAETYSSKTATTEYRHTHDTITHSGFTRTATPSCVVTEPQENKDGRIPDSQIGFRKSSMSMSIEEFHHT